MTNENWYYRFNTVTLVADGYQQIPESHGNITGLKDASDADLADLSWSGIPVGFLQEAEATALGVTNMVEVKAAAADVIYAYNKKVREKNVAAITVTTTSGKTFDGDETSQERMSRAAFVMSATSTSTTLWKLTDNSFVSVTVAELVEAIALAGGAQTALWNI